MTRKLEELERHLREVERQGQILKESKREWAKQAYPGWQWPLAARARAFAGFMSTWEPSTPLQSIPEAPK